MKKFFRILRQIIKILLKMIIYLILGIIVIGGIILAIINNKTLKIYENDKGNTWFTMDKSFVVENGGEIKLSLNNLNLTINKIDDLKIDYKYVFDVDFREGTLTFDGIDLWDSEIPGGYIDEHDVIKFKKLNFKEIKQGYENGDIYDIFEVFRYFVDGEEIRYYDNGQIEEKRIYVNGLENGLYVSYYENGQVEEEGNYFNGEEIGIRTGYYNNGYIKYVINEDNLDGTGFYENGNIEWIQNKNGYIKYYGNGKLFEEFNYIDGENGNGTGYYIDGKIFSYFTGKYFNLDYNYSDFSYTYLDKNGNILGNQEKKYYQVKNGLFIDIYENGQIKIKGNLINGKQDGYRVYYFNNGQIFSEGNFNSGSLVGYSTGYYKNGQIFSIIHVIDDENYSEIFYSESENTLGKLVVNNNEPGGLYMTRYDNGQIEVKGNYIGGKPDGYRVYYFENGKIKKEGNYKDGIRVGTRNRYLGDGTVGVSKNYSE